MKKLMILGLVLLSVAGSASLISLFDPYEPVAIAPSPQRTGGDAARGYEYLVTGDYVKGGIPLRMFLMGMGKDRENQLERDGDNKFLPPGFTAVTASNGEVLAAPNCLQCHAQEFEGKLIVGLGNSFSDFTPDNPGNIRNLEKLERWLRLTSKSKLEASASFIEVGKTIGPRLHTAVKGVNAADRLAAVLAAHRDPATFKWNSDAMLEIPSDVIPTDVPAWWMLKKKNAMFYNGFGRGDFGRFLMASNLLTVSDTAESREVDSHMPDVLAYLYSIEPPDYPKSIDSSLANAGEGIFIRNCASCHGTYGDSASFPNLLIPASIIQTDSMLYTSNYSNSQFVDWFNKSWFTMGPNAAHLEPYSGYLAPPLDGVWVTAPYLHNGSVPTLEALLNSSLRPAYWKRNFEKPEYDYSRIGWKFSEEAGPGGTDIYNTKLPGYSNKGHYFGDKLTQEERIAVLEYLKTL